MKNCVSVFVTDYQMLNTIVSDEYLSENSLDFLNKFFNYRIDLRDELPGNIFTYYDSFFNYIDPGFWSIYDVICKSPGTWYNEVFCGLTNKLNLLKSNSNEFAHSSKERKELEESIKKQEDCISLFVGLMKIPRNVVKFYNVFRNNALYCQKEIHLESNNDEVAKYIASRNIGQILYLISFMEVCLPSEYEQLKKNGSQYIASPIYDVNANSSVGRDLVVEITRGLIYGEYFEYGKVNEYIKEDIRKFINNFLSRGIEWYQLINTFNSQEENWLKAVEESDYQTIEKYWKEIILMVLQKAPDEEANITNMWRNNIFLGLLEFAQKQVEKGVWESDRIFCIF